MLLLAFGTSSASALTYEFEDLIDTWGGRDTRYINGAFFYTHDVNDDVNFLAGDLVTEAVLELDFTNDLLDWHGSICSFSWDFREYVTIGFDAATGSWMEIGEVDNGQFDLVVGIDWINDDGFLDVALIVWNTLGGADLWLDSSRLSGIATTTVAGAAVPVPEAATALLLGSGLLGLAGAYRKKLFRRGARSRSDSVTE